MLLELASPAWSSLSWFDSTMTKRDAKSSKECGGLGCRNNAASPAPNFCISCSKENASIANSPTKIFGGNKSAKRVFGNRGRRSDKGASSNRDNNSSNSSSSRNDGQDPASRMDDVVVEHSASEVNSQHHVRISPRALNDVDVALKELIPRDELVKMWDEGLSPPPCFSFQHKNTKCRHWALSDDPNRFICGRMKGSNHRRGGIANVDHTKDVCEQCMEVARQDSGIEFRDCFQKGLRSL